MKTHPSRKRICILAKTAGKIEVAVVSLVYRALSLDDSGQDLVEYSLFGLLLVLATTASMQMVANQVRLLVQAADAGLGRIFG